MIGMKGGGARSIIKGSDSGLGWAVVSGNCFGSLGVCDDSDNSPVCG